MLFKYIHKPSNDYIIFTENKVNQNKFDDQLCIVKKRCQLQRL